LAFEYNLYFSHNDNKEYLRILQSVKKAFDNFTILNAVGFYEGNSEISRCLRIIDFKNSAKTQIKLKVLCEIIKKIANQECVLFTKREIIAQLV